MKFIEHMEELSAEIKRIKRDNGGIPLPPKGFLWLGNLYHGGGSVSELITTEWTSMETCLAKEFQKDTDKDERALYDQGEKLLYALISANIQPDLQRRLNEASEEYRTEKVVAEEALRAENERLQEEVDELNATVTTLTSENTRLVAAEAALRAENERLKKELGESKDSVNKLQPENVRLAAAEAASTAHATEKEKTIKLLDTDVIYFRSGLDKKEAEFNIKETDYRKRLDQKESEIKAKESEIKAKENEIKLLGTQYNALSGSQTRLLATTDLLTKTGEFLIEAGSQLDADKTLPPTPALLLVKSGLGFLRHQIKGIPQQQPQNPHGVPPQPNFL